MKLYRVHFSDYIQGKYESMKAAKEAIWDVLEMNDGEGMAKNVVVQIYNEKTEEWENADT